MEYESAFLIHSPEEIISKLSILHEHKCLLTVYFGDNGDSFITTILSIYRENNYLVFHHGPKENLIEQLLNSPTITFRTEYLGIKVAFEANKLAKTQHQGVSIFVIPIPESMLWIEDRGFYRVKLPASKLSYCQLILNNQDPINLKLYDISLIGFSVLNTSNEISALMAPDSHFEQCKLVLADTDEDTISFTVRRRKYIINPANLNRMEKIGCKFTRITPEFESTIRRYMQQIERENRQKN
jgi:c-di-GMP-binding flagellar brake protein YcgR